MVYKDEERYIVRYGKFGAYFYDLKHQRPMTLRDVKDILNNFLNMILSEGYKVD